MLPPLRFDQPNLEVRENQNPKNSILKRGRKSDIILIFLAQFSDMIRQSADDL